MRYTQETELHTLELYRQGTPIKEICKILGVWKDYPSLIAKKHGIQRGSGKSFKIKAEKFSQRTAEADYWLGYLISDGNLSTKGYRISIASIDDEVIHKFMRFLEFASIFDRGYLKEVYFSSKPLHKYLCSLGITPKKSHTINLKVPLNRHILRGIIDGDGSIHNKRKVVKITTGSVALGNQIVDFLRTVKIFSCIRKRGADNCWDVWIERKEDFKKLFELLYKDVKSSVYMERKFNKFVALLGN
jgi:hypothetical protein